MFDDVLGLPVVMLGFTNPDDNAHAPNETMVLLNYETGLRTITRLWDDLGTMSPLGSSDGRHDRVNGGNEERRRRHETATDPQTKPWALETGHGSMVAADRARRAQRTSARRSPRASSPTTSRSRSAWRRSTACSVAASDRVS